MSHKQILLNVLNVQSIVIRMIYFYNLSIKYSLHKISSILAECILYEQLVHLLMTQMIKLNSIAWAIPNS